MRKLFISSSCFFFLLLGKAQVMTTTDENAQQGATGGKVIRTAYGNHGKIESTTFFEFGTEYELDCEADQPYVEVEAGVWLQCSGLQPPFSEPLRQAATDYAVARRRCDYKNLIGIQFYNVCTNFKFLPNTVAYSHVLSVMGGENMPGSYKNLGISDKEYNDALAFFSFQHNHNAHQAKLTVLRENLNKQRINFLKQVLMAAAKNNQLVFSAVGDIPWATCAAHPRLETYCFQHRVRHEQPNVPGPEDAYLPAPEEISEDRTLRRVYQDTNYLQQQQLDFYRQLSQRLEKDHADNQEILEANKNFLERLENQNKTTLQ